MPKKVNKTVKTNIMISPIHIKIYLVQTYKQPIKPLLIQKKRTSDKAKITRRILI